MRGEIRYAIWLIFMRNRNIKMALILRGMLTGELASATRPKQEIIVKENDYEESGSFNFFNLYAFYVCLRFDACKCTYYFR